MKELFNEFHSEEDGMSRNSSCKKCGNDKTKMNNQNPQWMQNQTEATQWDMNQNTWKADNNCKCNDSWKGNMNNECNDCVLGLVGLAQAYVPFQTSFDVMSQEQSLACGTIFRELVQPFKKGSGLGR